MVKLLLGIFIFYIYSESQLVFSLTMETQPERCKVLKEVGPCKGYLQRYYYNLTTNKCETFIYGGCKGNKNRFLSWDGCYNTCVIQPDKCKLPKEKGLCKAYFPRYFYNKMTNKCEKFVYGGCGKNENNFAKWSKCYDECVIQPDACKLPKEIGKCKGYFPKYFYNRKTNKCERIIYGGCNGNENRFSSWNKCHDKCVIQADVCKLPVKVCQVKSSVKSYYYNKKTNKCEIFKNGYGGCNKNGNRFSSLKKCQKKCVL